MRLEIRVTLWLLGLLGLSATATFAGMAWFQGRALDRQAQEAGHLLAMSVKNSLQVSMLNNAPEDIRETVTNIGGGTYVRSVSVYRQDGSVWVSSSPAEEEGTTDVEPIEPPAEMEGRGPRSAYLDGVLRVFVPVTNEARCGECHLGDGPVLGAVGVTLDERPLRGELERSARNSLFIAAVPLLIGVLASIWAVRRNVLRPLGMVGRAARGLASGDLTARVAPVKGWEFASVAAAFNEMAARLQRQADDLTRSVGQLRADLEGLEQIQSLIASGAGLQEVLARAAAHLGRALAASGVGIWRADAESPEATWGAPPSLIAAPREDGGISTSAGPLEGAPETAEVSWAVAPAARAGRTLAVVRIAWEPPRPLAQAERELITSLAALVAVAVENAELLERLRQEERALEGALKKTLFAQEEERRRVARELHDDTSQILHALMLNIDLLEAKVPGAFRDRLGAVKALAEQAGRNLDKVLGDLRPALLDELGLVAALRWSVAQVREASGLPIAFEVHRPRRLPEQVEVAAFRIVQEALANAVRHAQAQRIAVRVWTSERLLEVEVRDDGIGFDVGEAMARTRTGEAAGLLGMRERAELLGGRLSIESSAGAGTRVLAQIPVPEEPTEKDDDREDQGARR